MSQNQVIYAYCAYHSMFLASFCSSFIHCSFWYVDHENIISKPTKECENQSKKCIAHLRNHLCRLTLLWLLMSEKQSNIALLPLCLVRGRTRQRRESHAKREQPSGESSMHYKCCEIVGYTEWYSTNEWLLLQCSNH